MPGRAERLTRAQVQKHPVLWIILLQKGKKEKKSSVQTGSMSCSAATHRVQITCGIKQSSREQTEGTATLAVCLIFHIIIIIITTVTVCPLQRLKHLKKDG
ncbi:hypothetical protein JOB18_017554 [Solea senegalensis]|uniref:Uncharacterized protein n=1 Tax=Solea senegalensis TaxID=28829 RepID=A0AAV6T601_SOLSE|nr:hypothetical protein JOB18_017554 [Solea senegalensis]